jgi:hypothetical protein
MERAGGPVTMHEGRNRATGTIGPILHMLYWQPGDTG